MYQYALPLATGRDLRTVMVEAWLRGTLLPAYCFALLALYNVDDAVPLPAEWAHVWTHADVATEGVCSHH